MVQVIQVDSNDTLIVQFKFKELGGEQLDSLAKYLGKSIPCKVICFDSEVEITVVKK